MITFQVNDMSCGHCVKIITTAVKAVDQNARVDVDLASKRVQVDTSTATEAAIGMAIAEAGYTPVPIG